MPSKQDIIDQAMQIALAGGGPQADAALNADMTAEDLLPLAFRHAYKQLLNSGEMRAQDVLTEHTIALTANVGDLPANVLTEYLDSAFLPGYPYSSYLRWYQDYLRSRFDNLLSYFTVNNGSFYFSGISSPGNGNVTLHAPSVPAIPANPATDIDIPEAARDAVVHALAMALRGELKLIS